MTAAQRWGLTLATLCFSISFGPSLFAQDVLANLDDDNFFVISGTGLKLSGIDIKSTIGGLIPVPNNEAAPFTFLLSNTKNQVTYGNLGTTVTLDGSITTKVGWDPAVNDQNVEVAVGVGSTPVSATVALAPCEVNCPVPRLLAVVDENFNVVLNGQGHELAEVTFRSESNSLVPATESSPFGSAVVNTPGEIRLTSPDKVILDNPVALGLGWNPDNYVRDIEYEYQIFGSDPVGPFKLRRSDYDYALPEFPRIDVSVNQNDHFVIRGEGHPLTGLQISSVTGSLIPSGDAGPFTSLEADSITQVRYEVPDGFVLDGEIVLPAKWNFEEPKNVVVDYDLRGELRDERFAVIHPKFPQIPEKGKEPLLFSLDENNNFVITGIGQDVGGIEFSSATGALRPSAEDATPPFPILLSNTPESITLGVLGGVLVNGSFVTDFGPVDPDRLDEIDISVGYGRQAVSNPINEICARCEYPEVAVNEDRTLELLNFPQAVTELTFTSSLNALEPLTLPDGVSLVSSSPNEMVIAADAGFDAEKISGLQVLWGANSDSQVFVSFTLLDGTSFGPIPISAAAPAIPEPSSALLLLLGVLPLLRRRR